MRGRRGRYLALGAACGLGLLVAGCSSSGSVDASALPKVDATPIGRSVDAELMGTSADLPTFDDGNGHAAVPEGGRYQIGVRNPQSLVTATLDDTFPVDQVVNASFDASGGAVDSGFGIICRMADPDNYYRLGVGNDGTYAIQRVRDGTLTVLTGGGQWARGPTIRDTPGVFDVRADCVGDTLTLFAGNQPIAQVHDATIKGGTVGVFVETFRQPASTVQVDRFSVRAFRDRGRVTDATAAGWDELVRTQTISNRCALLDATRARAPAGTVAVTRCASVLLLRTEPTTGAVRAFARTLERAGTTLRSVTRLPDCSRRTGIRGPLPAPTPPGGVPDRNDRVGTVACLDLGGSTAVVWVRDAAGVIGVEQVPDGDRTAWKGYGRDWPPFAYPDQPGAATTATP
jgi:hypothetical protein